ncbi:MAG: FMN-binding negative transcriptional regulator [Betaproteobacteria bacterium]|nr:FMN-binding negative transcriptional regulator [Betaproteobacteria bacterium]
MYTPSAFQIDDTGRIDELVRTCDFATLLSPAEPFPWVTHAPLLWDRPALRLTGHLAAANPHAAALQDGARVLVLFHGPNGYVSPTWYVDENPAVPNVPTWNYAAVHMTGRVLRIDAAEEKFALVRTLTRVYEGDGADAWQPAAAAGNDARMRAIVGFHIAVETIEAKFKLSQNRSAADQAAVIAALESRGGDDDRAMARMMREGSGLATRG